jgi:hypothetical protein
MWINDKRREEENESAKGMKDRKETYKEWRYERNFSSWNFNGPFSAETSIMTKHNSILTECCVTRLKKTVASRGFLTAACVKSRRLNNTCPQRKTRVSWSGIGHWLNPWCENNIIIVTQLLLTCPRMLTYNLRVLLWIICCNLVIIIFRICCTAVVNKLYPCATYGPERGNCNVSTRENVKFGLHSLDRETSLLFWRQRQQLHPKRWQIRKKPIGVTWQNALIWIFNRPSNYRERVIAATNCLCLKPDL